MYKRIKQIALTSVLALTVTAGALIGCSDKADIIKNSSALISTADAASYSLFNGLYIRPSEVKSSLIAKKLLELGNWRFYTSHEMRKDTSYTKRVDLSKNGQKPFAVVISCSDSRVPPELLFDQGLGDIFVVRNAGNIIDPVTMGSIEYGAEHLGTPLIVVLGHEKCGAVKATVEGGHAPGSIGAITEKIAPTVEKLREAGVSEEELCSKSEDENIKNTMEEIKKSPIIKELEEENKVEIVGAKYHLESGKVTFDYEH